MTLRCRPGDLAIVVRCKEAWAIGRIVRVTQIEPGTCPGNPRWVLEAPLIGPVLYDFWSIADRCLRPIRPDADPVERGEPVEASHG